MKKKLQLFILPCFESVRDSMGFDDSDDYNTDAVLLQQGYNSNLIEVADNEVFEIEERFIARINSKKDYYLLSDEEDLENKEEFLIEDDLQEGRYKFSAKDRVIYLIDVEDNVLTDDIIQGTNDDSIVNKKSEEHIFDLITNSAKSRFDYESFSDKIGDEYADILLLQIMASLAIGESKELTAAKLNNLIMLRGWMMEHDAFVHFIEELNKVLAMEILALKIAKTNLDCGASTQAVYLQTKEFISKLNT